MGESHEPMAIHGPERSTDSPKAATAAEGRLFACLYSKHKTQKRKTWQDGKLCLRGTRAMLHAVGPTLAIPGNRTVMGSDGPMEAILDECEITLDCRNMIINGCASASLTLEMDTYLVTVEGPWTSSVPTTSSAPVRHATERPSNTMQKILSLKYRRPATKVPPPPARSDSRVDTVKRRRILQPGELLRQYYGSPSASATNCPKYCDLESRLVEGELLTRIQPARPIDDTTGTRGGAMALTHIPTAFPEDLTMRDDTLPIQASDTARQSSSRILTTSTQWHGNNGFDPTSFYGEEDEESSELELATNVPTSEAFRPWKEQTDQVKDNYPVDSTRLDNLGYDPYGFATSIQDTVPIRGTVETLSSAQLYDLFGNTVAQETSRQQTDCDDVVQEDDFVLPQATYSSDEDEVSRDVSVVVSDQ